MPGSPSSSRGVSSVLLSATVTLTNAQILAMNTGPPPYFPVTVVPAASGVGYAILGAAWSSHIVDDYTPNNWLAVASTAGIDAASYTLDLLFVAADVPPSFKSPPVGIYDLTSDIVVGSDQITGGGNAANTARVTVYYLAVTPMLS